MNATENPTTQNVTVQVQANAARLAAEELFQSARNARDNDESPLARLLEDVAGELHRAGWDAAKS